MTISTLTITPTRHESDPALQDAFAALFGETRFDYDGLGGGTCIEFTYRDVLFGLYENLTPDLFDGAFLLAPVEPDFASEETEEAWTKFNEAVSFGAHLTFGVPAGEAAVIAATVRSLVDGIPADTIALYLKLYTG